MRKKGYNVLPQMFDVKPVDQTGNIDFGRMRPVGKTSYRKEENKRESIFRNIEELKNSVNVIHFNRILKPDQADEYISRMTANKCKVDIGDVMRSDERPRNFIHNFSTQGFVGKKKAIAKKKDVLEENLSQKKEEPPVVSEIPEIKIKIKSYSPDYYHPAKKLPFQDTDRWNPSEAIKEKSSHPLLEKVLDEFEEKPQRLKSKKKKEPSIIKEKNRKIQKDKSLWDLIVSNYQETADAVSSQTKWFLPKPAWTFGMFLLASTSILLGAMFASKSFFVKTEIMTRGEKALGYLAEAKEDLASQNIAKAQGNFENAREEFERSQKELDGLGGDALDIFSHLPYLSKASSGKNIVDAGKNLTEAAEKMSSVIASFSQIKSPFGAESKTQEQSLTDLFQSVSENISATRDLLSASKDNLDKVSISDIPDEYQEKFSKIQKALPLVISMMDDFKENSEIFLELLGKNGQRKYLFIFQNNQEMRATGGFIGSYGIMDINDGHIKNIFIDGIYNPDGQLLEKVVPPKPIQKISAAWSTHDANWFPNFPTSAEKVAWFYEKTGGPTVDGVISLTPTVLQQMLEITGPIEMPEYGTTVDKDNFIEKTQYEVEVDYDKELNQPKKFIADLAPIILDRALSSKKVEDVSMLMTILSDALKEKHILLYSLNHNIQQIISDRGWSGEVLSTGKDFLMVINSNVNGFKTDGVIDETITHKAEIQPDGFVVDTVKIKRVHNGGDAQYEWWNKVNSDYMRVYVPEGSKLLEVKGQTREFNSSPLSYDQLGFRHDPDVEKEEQSMEIDDATGTRIYKENGKTVFANWVYVSPRESVEIEYKYLLPFKVDLAKNKDHVDNYSLLAEKQSGSLGSKFSSQIVLPTSMRVVWKYPETAEIDGSTVNYSQPLSQDRFLGLVLQRK